MEKSWEQKLEDQNRIFGHLSARDARAAAIIYTGATLTAALKRIAPSEMTETIIRLHNDIVKAAETGDDLVALRKKADGVGATLYQRAFGGNAYSKILYEIVDALRRSCEPEPLPLLLITIVALTDAAAAFGIGQSELVESISDYARSK